MDQKLRKIQLVLLDILKDIDRFCRDNGVHYSLYAGSLLGAVRHQGFIPWDDDLDICMARPEYDRFIRLWEKDKIEGYVLQNKENTPAFPQSFTKIRKTHTTFLSNEYDRGKFHTGIFVDVFPIDRLPIGFFARKQFQFECMRYQLYTREFIPPNSNFLVKSVSAVLLSAASVENRPSIRNRLLEQIKRENGRGDTVGIETFKSIMTPLPADLLDGYEYLPFEDGKFQCFKNWDGYLKAKFGDYMTLPPETERTWKHHPIILDFEHDYEELHQADPDRFP